MSHRRDQRLTSRIAKECRSTPTHTLAKRAKYGGRKGKRAWERLVWRAFQLNRTYQPGRIQYELVKAFRVVIGSK